MTCVTDRVTIFIARGKQVIKSFKDKELGKFFNTGKGRIPQPKHRRKTAMILDLLDAATDIGDMNFPGSRLHKLEPKSAERYAVSVSGNWRIVFVFINGDAYEVEYVDYH